MALVKTPRKPNPILVKKYHDILEGVLKNMVVEAKVSVDQGNPWNDFSILVVPSNPNSASVQLNIVQEDFAYFHAGQGTTFEIPAWGASTFPSDSRSKSGPL